jgi:hypothetical protein
MVGNQDRWREDAFVACPLRELVPEDHILRRVDRLLDLGWLRDEVADCYCADNGRLSIDPEAAVRLMRRERRPGSLRSMGRGMRRAVQQGMQQRMENPRPQAMEHAMPHSMQH